MQLPFLASTLLLLPTLFPSALAASFFPSLPIRSLVKRLPDKYYRPGEFDIRASKWYDFLTLDNDVHFKLQDADNNFVVYVKDQAFWADGVEEPAGCSAPHDCRLAFQPNGNLVHYYDDKKVWCSGTAGTGRVLAFFDTAPHVVIFNDLGARIWWSAMPKDNYGGPDREFQGWDQGP